MQNEIATSAAKAAPPVAVTVAQIAGMPLSEWVTVATLTYIVLQVGLLIPKYWREYRAMKGECDVKDD